MTTTHSLNDKDLKGLQRLSKAITALQTISPTMPIQLAHSFVLVALHEGASLGDLCKLTGFATSTMSRHLLDLSDRNRKLGSGFGLVERRQDPDELRRNIYTLTPKGRALARSILGALD